jgi:hypothetical protein
LNDVSAHPGVNTAERMSIFVPYSIVLREWGLLQAKLDNPNGSQYVTK